MPEKVLGLDISSKTVKAVLLQSKGRSGGRILAAETLDIDNCGGPAAALKRLAENRIFVDASCVISLPSPDVLFRYVTLPFHDDGKIRKILPFELEPLLPYPSDEIVADYLTTPQKRLLVAVVTKNQVREWIKLGENYWRKVPVLGVASVSIASLVLTQIPAESAGMVIDIGAEATTAIFYEDGSIIQVRFLAFGGDQITAALAEDLSLDRRGAEQVKINWQHVEAGAQTATACRRFCGELRNTLEYLHFNKILNSFPTQIALTGGGALFPLLQQQMTNCFSLPVELLDLCRIRKIEIEEEIKNKYQPQMMNTALANALHLSAGISSFNFRRGEFKMQRASGVLAGQWSKAAVIVLIMVVLAGLHQYLDYRLEANRLGIIKKQISLLFKKNLPEAVAMTDPLHQLKTKITENQKAFGFYGGGPENISVLDLLKEISEFILPTLDILIADFSLENNVILIKGEAENIDALAAVKAELIKSKYFKEVVVNSTRLAKKDRKVVFDLMITLK